MINIRVREPEKYGSVKRIISFSLRGITRAGSKGMISARNY